MVLVADESSVGTVRRRAAALATRAGLSDTERGTLAVVVTEAATNLARHAADGIVALRTLGTPPGGVEVLALDESPGIHDLLQAMADGYSTGGTAGRGLGAIRRMASEFDLFSSAEHGTALLARV
jgi:anti-sigma regulatory factor (Ser/Thr protein kinase)